MKTQTGYSIKIKTPLLALILAITAAALALLSPLSAAAAQDFTPSLISAGFSADKTASPGGSVKLSFKLKNTSPSTDIRNVNIRISGGEAFTVASGSDSVYADRIAKGGEYSFSKSVYCSSSAQTGVYPVTLSASYEYFDGQQIAQGAAEINYAVSVSGGSVSQSLTPQLIISDYSYGGSYVAGGDEFALDITLENTSKEIPVQNVVVKFSGGEAFAISGSADTAYEKKISSSATFSKSFRCLPAAVSGAYPITVSASYEYFDGGEKLSQTAELSVSVRVLQPESAEIGSVSLNGQTVVAGQEQDCGFTVINSGRSDISNCRVRLVSGEEELASAYIGNIAAGEQFQSNYTLPVTFKAAGAQQLSLVLDYENESGEKKSVSRDFTVTAQEKQDPYEQAQEQLEVTQGGGDYTHFYILAAVLAVIIAAVVAAVVIKRRKKRKAGELSDEEL